MDAFFASIEQRDHPSYRNKPVIVGANPQGGAGRGVVATCSYEARVFGIHSAMPISLAYQKCPQGIFLPVDLEKYENESRRIHEILYSFTPQIEPISIDEAFCDITKSYHLFGTPRAVSELIKCRIKKETGLTASVGCAPTKMAAKIASDLRKPDGLVIVEKKELPAFLWPLDISHINGLGKKTAALLYAKGIRTIGDIAQQDCGAMVSLLGKSGAYFWELSRGIDNSEVASADEIKSVSNETTFEHDINDHNTISSTLMLLCEKVSRRLREGHIKGKTITLKVRLADFKTYTRAITRTAPTNFADVIFKEIHTLWITFEYKYARIRLLGVKASQLRPADAHDDLFSAAVDGKREKIHEVIDQIQTRFGDDAIGRATGKCH
jgi:nucleotidyltransferase/DNA polymerase involved in DNA repair